MHPNAQVHMIVYMCILYTDTVCLHTVHCMSVCACMHLQAGTGVIRVHVSFFFVVSTSNTTQKDMKYTYSKDRKQNPSLGYKIRAYEYIHVCTYIRTHSYIHIHTFYKGYFYFFHHFRPNFSVFWLPLVLINNPTLKVTNQHRSTQILYFSKSSNTAL